MRSNLPNKILGIVFATVLVLCGCSGFTSDPPVAGTTDDSGVNLQKEFAMARTYAQGSYEVKESSETTKTGVIFISLVQESGCVKQGETYRWVDDLNYISKPDGGEFRYNFVGDTLTLTALNDEPDYYGNVTVLTFVGGESGKLQGVWRLLGHSVEIMYWNFSKGSIEIRIGEDPDFNYMKTEFMWFFYDGLSDTLTSFPAAAIYYSDDIDASKYGVEILNQTNTSESFVYNGVTYHVNIDSVHTVDLYLALTVSAGDSKCHLNFYKTFNVTPEMCKAENDEFLHTSKDNVVGNYSYDNEREFKSCMNKLVVESGSAPEGSASEFESEFLSAYESLKRPLYYLGKSADGMSEVYAAGYWNTDKCGSMGPEKCGGCKKEGDGFKWSFGVEHENPYADTLTFSFRGDTLMMLKGENKYITFVGGTQGNVEGIWKKTNVAYIGDSLVDLSTESSTLEYMKIQKDSITYAFDMNPAFNYMESALIYGIKNHLVDGSSNINFDGVFETLESKLKDGISLLSHSNTSDVVSINGNTYEITVNHAYWLWDDVSVTVKSGDMTCSGRYVQFELMTQEMCSTDNADYLESWDEGETFYVIDEQKSFEQCLSQMVSSSTNP